VRRVVTEHEAGIVYVDQVILSRVPTLLQEAPAYSRRARCAFVSRGFQERLQFFLAECVEGPRGEGGGVVVERGGDGNAFFGEKSCRKKQHHFFVVIDQFAVITQECRD
jgi:hypothetical protein